jgi:hypothetical protein
MGISNEEALDYHNLRIGIDLFVPLEAAVTGPSFSYRQGVYTLQQMQEKIWLACAFAADVKRLVQASLHNHSCSPRIV